MESLHPKDDIFDKNVEHFPGIYYGRCTLAEPELTPKKGDDWLGLPPLTCRPSPAVAEPLLLHPTSLTLWV